MDNYLVVVLKVITEIGGSFKVLKDCNAIATTLIGDMGTWECFISQIPEPDGLEFVSFFPKVFPQAQLGGLESLVDQINRNEIYCEFIIENTVHPTALCLMTSASMTTSVKPKHVIASEFLRHMELIDKYFDKFLMFAMMNGDYTQQLLNLQNN